MQIDTSSKAATVEPGFKVKKRAEALAEQQVSLKKKGIDAALREFYAAKGHSP